MISRQYSILTLMRSQKNGIHYNLNVIKSAINIHYAISLMDATKEQLNQLYVQFADIMEHLHIVNGGIELESYEYKQEYLKNRSFIWLYKKREEIMSMISLCKEELKVI